MSTSVFPGASEARRIIAVRALRGFADGLVSVLLAGYLLRLGFSTVQVGVLVAGTLLGSAALTIAVGVTAHRFDRRRLLLLACVLMLCTGLGFVLATSFWPLLVIAVVGTLNPSSGDVSVFLPTEQAALADATALAQRTQLFARYNVAGNVAAALGALASALPALVAGGLGLPLVDAERAGFAVYAAVAVVSALVYRGLASTSEAASAHGEVAPSRARPLRHSRANVLRLAALFSLDSFGGGFVVQAMLVLWLHQRFALSVEAAGMIFFVAGLASALAQLASPALAGRFGLVETMVGTHLPANVLLIVAGVAPNASVAVAALLGRAALSQMDVPPRQAYVMAIVPPAERAAAASLTNVPRSLAAAIPPLFTGVMLSHSTFGWPLVCAGGVKLLYDVLLLVQERGRSVEL
ncbi:MFS transporter [Candidatus Binatia bacterium]|jgi:MFS family permease|nr:MFS transporter [Candidatus Binatia bacterium]